MYWNGFSINLRWAGEMLNSNIRCIEIRFVPMQNWIVLSWIVTLDVLKWLPLMNLTKSTISWIVTLDVLK